MLQISEEVLDEFDLKKYNTSDEGRRRLIPAVLHCRKALLADCNLTGQFCESLSSSLQSSNSLLRELDLSNNDLWDSGVKPLSDGLKSSHCQLNILRKNGAGLWQGGSLAAPRLQEPFIELAGGGLQKEWELTVSRLLSLANLLLPPKLVERPLSKGNNILIHHLLFDTYLILYYRLANCNLTGQFCESLSSSLQSPNSLLKELDLSNNDLCDSGVKLLSDGLKSSHCQLNILRLSGCMVTEKGCCYLASALSSNPSHLRELDLSYNHPGKLLFKLVSDPNYRLDKLNVDHGGIIRITAGLHKYACDLTLDLNTANTHLALSERNRKVTHVEEEQSYPDHPERFDELPQVLCRESLSGRCYWEAEWSGWADISMMYKGISRRGKSDDCWFGYNEKSWSLNCIKNSFTVRHNNKSTDISVPSHLSNRVGVYLDWLAGTLSFYSISETHTLTHLHTLNSKFTEPLYAGFGVYFSGSVSLCEKQQRRTVK
ncbi:NACHT, LRR and PYD domains-containing protein 12-like [Megalobrama amblycephala]|uniref:NACHT, LRR and PYD domains-containing protein 12-like n=1 Tax=Megalobrama amblycephala TaxID=75352 RepID=UPI0020144808|nr:NACHT, LRR and PYD domains-containing protein 12-like [Megalobrama amblycephala]